MDCCGLGPVLLGVWVCERGVRVMGGSIDRSGEEVPTRGLGRVGAAGPVFTGEIERARSGRYQH